MANARKVASVALLAIVCHVAAAGPNDEQILVQRSAVVQQNDLSIDGPLDERADSSIANVKKLQQAQGNAIIGRKGEICSAEDMLTFQSETKAYQKLDKKLSAQFQEDVANVSKTILMKHVEPLKQAYERVEKTTSPILKPIFRDIIKHHLIQLFNPATKYDARSVVRDLNQSMDALKTALTSQQDPIKAILTETFTTFDSLLNKTQQDLPVSDHLVKSKLVRLSPPEMNVSDISQYFASKVLPLMAVEIFPSLAKPINVMGRIPKDQAAFTMWLLSEAIPAFTQTQKEWDELMKKYKPEGALPVRLCSTCEEKHAADANSCKVGCFEILTTCASGVNSNCVLAGSKCIKCLNKHSAMLDSCTGNATHAKDIASWGLIAKALDNATTPEGVDSLLDNISHIMLDGAGGGGVPV